MHTKQHGSPQLTQNQNNLMSEDPKDGGRNSGTTGRIGQKTAVERAPEEGEHEDSNTEAFAEEGAGIASKE